MRSHVVVLVVAGILPALAASSPPKPAWQWTVDERLAARFDEAARNQRVDEYVAQRTARQGRHAALSTPAAPSRPTDVIHGSAHPELLMPHEIFTLFTRAAYE